MDVACVEEGEGWGGGFGEGGSVLGCGEEGEGEEGE